MELTGWGGVSPSNHSARNQRYRAPTGRGDRLWHAPEQQDHPTHHPGARAQLRLDIAVFGQTGTGKPVTEHVEYHEFPEAGLGIYDTKGLELGRSVAQLIGEIDDVLTEHRGRTIQACWYCVPAEPGRLTEGEQEIIKHLADRLPVVLVVTKALNGGLVSPAADFVGVLDDLGLPVADGEAVPLHAPQDEETGQKKHGLDRLYDVTWNHLSDEWQAVLDRTINDPSSAKTPAPARPQALGSSPPRPLRRPAWWPPRSPGRYRGTVFGADRHDREPFRTRQASLSRSVVARVAGVVLGVVGGRVAIGALLKVLPVVGAIAGVVNGALIFALVSAVGLAWIAVCAAVTLGQFRTANGELDDGAIGAKFQDEFRRVPKDTERRRASSGGMRCRQTYQPPMARP